MGTFSRLRYVIAANVNALDEVPNSSWFTNRIGLGPLSPAELAAGPAHGRPELLDGPDLVGGLHPAAGEAEVKMVLTERLKSAIRRSRRRSSGSVGGAGTIPRNSPRR